MLKRGNLILVLVTIAVVLALLYIRNKQDSMKPGSQKCEAILSEPVTPGQGITASQAKCQGQL